VAPIGTGPRYWALTHGAPNTLCFATKPTVLGVVAVVASLHRVRGILIAIVALALSASLAFGAEPPAAAAPGLANAASHAGKTVPVQAGDEDGDGGEAADEETGDEESDEEGGDHCANDPRTLTDEQLAELNHGAIVCWAAHQTEWPAEFKNHGAWVRSWAQWGKGDDESESEADATTNGKGHGKGKGNPNRD
jgi:hypothetical protein